jgi:3-dehydroquinate dehydratase/shikimate dehydrogenase
VTVTGADSEAMRAARTAAEPHADMVELRLDMMASPDPDGALAGRTRPAIVTCRPRREGGLFDGPESDRLRILWRAHELGAEFIDVEWDTDFAALREARGGRGLIVSRHIFDGTPQDAPSIVDDLRRRGCEVAKLAVMASRLSDVRTLLGAAREDRSSVLIAMGPCGMVTRILAARFGSRWTYAGDAVAPGQVGITRLLNEFHFRRIRSDAGVYGVLGRPVAHSLSPAMHNAGFAALGLNAVYVPLETQDLEQLRVLALELGIKGLSVTIPFKTDVVPMLDMVTETATAAGAVNTIAIDMGHWVGLNTDAEGFIAPLRERLGEMKGLRAVIMGAGGAARAAALALRDAGAQVRISARRAEAAQAVAQQIGVETVDWPPPRESWDVLVNATPVGGPLAPGATPFAGPFDGPFVYDLVYDPDPTELLRRAQQEGCRTLGGLEMLVAQAERQFEIWTGQRPPDGVFDRAARAALNDRTEAE